MEDFSTLPRAATPWIANLATLAVVIAAIGWSSGQRPPSSAAETAAQAPVTPQAQRVSDSPVVAPPLPAQPNWPAQTTALSIEGLQTIGFQPVKAR